MSQALVQHAQRNVWSEPSQDFQHNVGLARLTPHGGVIYSQEVLWHLLLVPEHGTGTRKWFHIYQVGQVPPKIFGLSLKLDHWVPLTDLCESQSMLIDLYLESGAMIPRSHVWLMVDFSRNITVAIHHDKNIDYGIDHSIDSYTGKAKDTKITLDNARVIIRFYANAHFSNISFRDLAVNPNKPIQFNYKRVESQRDFDEFMVGCDTITKSFSGRGKGTYYTDGFITSLPRGYKDDLKGKVLGFYWDESFKFDKMFKIQDLEAFTSQLDFNRQKYLLVTDSVYDIIDFQDDIDFYVVTPTARGFKGVYLNRVKDYAVRMVTHSAYSIDAGLVEHYINIHEFLNSVDDCYIFMQVRQGGMLSGLLNQKNRIEELYRMNLPMGIEQVMVDTLSLVPEWRADELEASAYTQLMRADFMQLQLELVQEAYGYSAVTTVMASPVHEIKRLGYVEQVAVPPVCQIPDEVNGYAKRAVWCYDANGQLINYFNDSSSDILVTIPQEITGTDTVEIFNGENDDDAGIWVNMDVSHNDLEQYGFRCYACPMYALQPNEEWEDITHQPHWYTYTEGTSKTDASIVWNWSMLAQAGLIPAVKSNAKVTTYTYTHSDLTDKDGVVDFIVKARQRWAGEYKYREQTVPPAQFTVFANGQTLIEDVDFYAVWPKIVIVNLKVNRAPAIEVIVRSYGCGKSIENAPSIPYKPREIGFVKNGRLSVDGEYDVHNDKNIKITVAGHFMRRDQVSLSEDGQMDDSLAKLMPDGRPYAISDYILPVENFTTGKRTNEFYEESFDIDSRVSQFISEYVPEHNYGIAKVEGHKWEVVSPILMGLCYAIKNGYAIDGNTNENFTSLEVEHWIGPWLNMLPFDPAYVGVDSNYIHIAPHPWDYTIEMTQKQYELLEWVIKLKLNNKIDISRYITIKLEGE